MKGHHRQMEEISAGTLAAGLAAAPISHHVIWTGLGATGQPGSLRIRALACVHEVGVPVSLRVVLQRAARLDGDRGLDPTAVRSCIRAHQGAKPAVLLLVERRSSGDFVAVTDIPHAGGPRQSVRAGEVLVDSRGVLQIGRPSGPRLLPDGGELRPSQVRWSPG